MIAIGSDHAGFELKQQIMEHLKSRGLQFKDYGTYSSESCNYPDYALKVANAILNKECQVGILICGTGVGISIAANKVCKIRAACCSDTFSARFTKMHNDANIICLGARVVGQGLACDIVDAFLNAEFEGGKHQLRVDMITEIENNFERKI